MPSLSQARRTGLQRLGLVVRLAQVRCTQRTADGPGLLVARQQVLRHAKAELVRANRVGDGRQDTGSRQYRPHAMITRSDCCTRAAALRQEAHETMRCHGPQSTAGVARLLVNVSRSSSCGVVAVGSSLGSAASPVTYGPPCVFELVPADRSPFLIVDTRQARVAGAAGFGPGLDAG